MHKRRKFNRSRTNARNAISGGFTTIAYRGFCFRPRFASRESSVVRPEDEAEDEVWDEAEDDAEDEAEDDAEDEAEDEAEDDEAYLTQK